MFGRAGVAALALALVLVLTPVAGAAADPAPFVDVGAHVLSREGRDFTILDQPQVACLVSQLLPEADVAMLEERLERLDSSERLGARAEDGSFFWDASWMSAGRCEVALLWVHPDGRVAGVLNESCRPPWRAFTNDPALLSAPPPPIGAWLAERRTASAGLEPWHVAAEAGPSARCSAKAQRAAIAADADRRAGRLCDALSPAGPSLAVVAPVSGTRAALRGKAACGGKGKGDEGSLLSGDIVELGAVSGDCTCVVQRRSGGVSAGWLATAELRRLGEPGGWLMPGDGGVAPGLAEAGKGLIDPPSIVSRWVGRGAAFAMRRDDATGGWSLVADRGGEIVGELPLARDGRLLVSQVPGNGEGDGGCRVVMFVGNNALAVGADPECARAGLHVGGIFHRDRPVR